jgi:hypothetical protein
MDITNRIAPQLNGTLAIIRRRLSFGGRYLKIVYMLRTHKLTNNRKNIEACTARSAVT